MRPARSAGFAWLALALASGCGQVKGIGGAGGNAGASGGAGAGGNGMAPLSPGPPEGGYGGYVGFPAQNPTSPAGFTLAGARFGKDGAIDGFSLPSFTSMYGIGAATTATLSLVASGSDQGVAAVRIDSSGNVLDSPPISISVAGTGQGPIVATDGTDFVIAWLDGTRRGIYLARVGADGTVTDPDGLLVATDTDYASVAFGAGEYLVTWADSSTTDPVRAVRVTKTSGILDATPLTLALDTNVPLGPVVASDGQHFLVAWFELGHMSPSVVHTCVVNPDGTAATPLVLAGSDGAQNLAIAESGGQYLMTWELNNMGVYAQVLDATGATAGQSFVISTDVSASIGAPSPLPSGWLVGFALGVNGEDGMGATRVSAQGTVLDVPPFQLTPKMQLGGQPLLTYNGSIVVGFWLSE
jgi:hypothetical protein